MKWIKYNGDPTTAAFEPGQWVEVQLRNGIRDITDDPIMLKGWQHATWDLLKGNDIIEYRIVN